MDIIALVVYLVGYVITLGYAARRTDDILLSTGVAAIWPLIWLFEFGYWLAGVLDI